MPTMVCGDGILQVPNDSGQNEQCERAINQVCSDGSTAVKDSNGDYKCTNGTLAVPTLGDFPDTCTTTCRLKTTPPSSSSSGSGDPERRPVITIPNHGDITFYPQGKIIIGNAMNAIREFGGLKPTPTIVNESDYDLYFDELCIVKKDASKLSLNGQDEQCKSLG